MELDGALQLRSTSCCTAVPVPLIATTDGLPEDELLTTLNSPAATPFVVGANCTSRATARFGLSVTGNVAPDIAKPMPVNVAERMVRGAVPVELRVRACVIFELSAISPKLRLDGEIVS